MFWKNFILLCNIKGISPNNACAKLGYSNAIATKWKNGSVPRSTTLQKIADYFGVTVEYLLQDNEKEKTISQEEADALFDKYNVLDEEEKAKIEEYIDFLLAQREKRK